ncbi:hypothetical protein HDU93_010008 [Gonapodya sp. JEL0774]|nr:hypothetical protein HDU93_010008 [Gonapodya sp. JEL0774]
MVSKSLLFAMAALFFSASTTAHVSLKPTSVANGTTTDFAFRIGHGCDALYDTEAMLITIPPQFTSVRPRFSLNQNVTVTKTANGTTVAVQFLKSVPNALYDYVEIAAKSPATAGVFYFPVNQTCFNSSYTSWTQINATGDAEVPNFGPAPSVTVTLPQTNPTLQVVPSASASTSATATSTASAAGSKGNSGARSSAASAAGGMVAMVAAIAVAAL